MNYTLVKLIRIRFVTTQMDLDGIMLCEINQTEEKIYYDLIYQTKMLINIENRSIVEASWRNGQNGEGDQR